MANTNATINHDEIRRAVKARQKARSGGKFVARELSLFEAIKADKAVITARRKMYADANRLVNKWFDLANVAGQNGLCVSIPDYHDEAGCIAMQDVRRIVENDVHMNYDFSYSDNDDYFYLKRLS